MKPNPLVKRVGTCAISLGLVATSIAFESIVLAQQPPPLAPSPAAPPQPTAPVAELPPSTSPGQPQSKPMAPPPKLGRPGTLPPMAPKPSPALPRTILDEELDSNPQAAAKNYEAIISSFDQQREAAANAIFRLGESYRKMGRIEEARLMFARILREFVDFPDLAKLSQRLLSENVRIQSVQTPDASETASSPEEEALIRQEIALLEEELASSESRRKAGLESPSSLLSLKREILQLQQRLVRARTQRPTTSISVDSQPIKVSTASPRSADSTGDLGQLQIETEDLKSQIRFLSEQGRPEAISPQIINDPRFAALKESFESALLRASDSDSSRKEIDDARDRLLKWIHEIYLPELKSTLELKSARLGILEKRSQQIGH